MPAKEVEALKKAVRAAQVVVRKPVIDLALQENEPVKRPDAESRRG